MAVNVKTRLESTHFTMVIATRRILQDCLDNDSKHIMPESVGAHVVQIQKALLAIDGEKYSADEKTALQKEIDVRKYGRTTRGLVLRYKKDRSIKREGRDFDDVVGRMTIDRLDTDMKTLQGDDVVVVKTVQQDILIRIMGQDPMNKEAGTETQQGQPSIGVIAVPDLARKINTEAYLKTHFPVKIINFNGGHEKRGTSPNSSIVVQVGLTKANVPRLAKPAGMEEAVAAMGRIVILGWSSGGRNAVQVARELQGAGNRIDYVGLADAAYDDRSDPLIAKGVTPAGGDSFYEAATNVLTSDGFEFHAAAAGTTDNMLDATDPFYQEQKAAFLALTFQTDGRKEKFFDACHARAVIEGYQRIERRALSLLS
jgi:hypothetical protein